MASITNSQSERSSASRPLSTVSLSNAPLSTVGRATTESQPIEEQLKEKLPAIIGTSIGVLLVFGMLWYLANSPISPLSTAPKLVSLADSANKQTSRFIDRFESREVSKLVSASRIGMVRIPGGAFEMGGVSTDPLATDAPLHLVELTPFWIDRCEVTNRQFATFVDETKYISTAEQLGYGRVWDPLRQEYLKVTGATWRNPHGPDSTIVGRDYLPVVQVSWRDAIAFSFWAGKRLPTEAEWEYASRGGRANSAFPWGAELQLHGRTMANLDYGDELEEKPQSGDVFGQLSPAGAFAANDWGLFDPVGNASEWCSDWYHAKSYRGSALKNPRGPDTGDQRVIRGAHWGTLSRAKIEVDLAFRSAHTPDWSSDTLGFRCAMTDTPSSPILDKRSGSP